MWTDNPTPMGFVVVGAFGVQAEHPRSVEIEQHPDGRYRVVAGNLFGSQAIECGDAAACVAVLCLVGGKNIPTLPMGCREAKPVK